MAEDVTANLASVGLAQGLRIWSFPAGYLATQSIRGSARLHDGDGCATAANYHHLVIRLSLSKKN